LALRFLKDNRGIESTEVALIIAVVVLQLWCVPDVGPNIRRQSDDIAEKSNSS
jgi:Flp pilus assembly pilin Flp